MAKVDGMEMGLGLGQAAFKAADADEGPAGTSMTSICPPWSVWERSLDSNIFIFDLNLYACARQVACKK